MIATRFRSVYWVGGVAIAALSCYLVSQRVAAERATLVRTEVAIVSAKRDIRALQTEIGTRAGMHQIEQWNADVLSLTAPRASQFVGSEVQLAALVQPVQPAMAGPAVIEASATMAVPAAAGISRVNYPMPTPAAGPAPTPAAAPAPVRAPAPVATIALRPAPSVRAPQITRVSYPGVVRASLSRPAADDGDDTPRVRTAVYVKPGGDHQNVALLDDKLLGDIDRLAASEREGKRSR